MTQALALDRRCKVLEIGTGSGYQAAILAKLARRVYTIERHRPLARAARQLLDDLGLTNVTVITADGTATWPTIFCWALCLASCTRCPSFFCCISCTPSCGASGWVSCS